MIYMKKISFIRAPIVSTIRRSPFNLLIDHSEKVMACVVQLKEGVGFYLSGDYEKSIEYMEIVSRLEHEADMVKANIRSHIPKSVSIPVDKLYFLMCLKEQDSIADSAQDILTWLNYRKTEIPPNVREIMKEHLNRSIMTVEVLSNAIQHLKLWSEGGFGRDNERGVMKNIIKEVHLKEWESDQLASRTMKEIFSSDSELDPISIWHVSRVVDLIDSLADHAENTADWLRAMLSR